MYSFWEWSLRFVFLLCILLTGLLYLLLIRRVLSMTRRKRETRILNELEHIATSEHMSEQRNQALLKTLMQVFATYRIDDARILQPDNSALLGQSEHYPAIEQSLLSIDEQDIASWVLTYGYDVSLYESFPHILSTHSRLTHRAIIPASMHESTTGHYVRFLPLKVGIKTVAVLRLSICNEAPFFPYLDIVDRQNNKDKQAIFFWKYLGQIATYIEHVPVAEPVNDREEISLS